MACFHVISISLISSGDHPFAHYFLWILPMCALPLRSMTHYDITMAHDVARMPCCGTTMGNDVARDIHCDATMDNDGCYVYIT